MIHSKSLPERLEVTVIGLLGIAVLMIVQPFNHMIYQLGLLLLVVCTFSEIAIGNMPVDAGPAQCLKYAVIIIALICGVFLLGISLVPYLTQLGR